MCCDGRGKRGSLVEKGKRPWQEKRCYNDFFMGEEKMKTSKDKTMVKLYFFSSLFKVAFFNHMLSKKSTHPFFG